MVAHNTQIHFSLLICIIIYWNWLSSLKERWVCVCSIFRGNIAIVFLGIPHELLYAFLKWTHKKIIKKTHAHSHTNWRVLSVHCNDSVKREGEQRAAHNRKTKYPFLCINFKWIYTIEVINSDGDGMGTNKNAWTWSLESDYCFFSFSHLTCFPSCALSRSNRKTCELLLSPLFSSVFLLRVHFIRALNLTFANGLFKSSFPSWKRDI